MCGILFGMTVSYLPKGLWFKPRIGQLCDLQTTCPLWQKKQGFLLDIPPSSNTSLPPPPARLARLPAPLPPPNTHRHPPPTANQQPPPTTHHPPPTTHHPLPTTNHHPPPTAIHRQPPPTANHHPPPTTNYNHRQPQPPPPHTSDAGWTYQILGVSLVVVGTLLLLFTFQPAVTLVAMCAFVGYVCLIVGSMPVLRIRLNSISIINLVFGVGLAVEYIGHIAFAFAKSAAEAPPGPGRRGVHCAVEGSAPLFWPLLHGFWTSFLAVVALAFSSVPLFRQYFFAMYAMMLAFALFMGLVVVPVLLSLLPDAALPEPPPPRLPVSGPKVAVPQAPLPPYWTPYSTPIGSPPLHVVHPPPHVVHPALDGAFRGQPRLDGAALGPGYHMPAAYYLPPGPSSN